MLENIIKFETAKLAKSKGFVKNGSYYYDNETGESYLLTAHNRIDLITDRYIKAPTQTLLQKWLRTEHNIEVYVMVNYYYKGEKLGYYCKINKFDVHNLHDGQTYIEDDPNFITYEQALEAGLFKALHLIN